MGWFAGCVGPQTAPDLFEFLKSQGLEPRVQLRHGDARLFAGGLADTILTGKSLFDTGEDARWGVFGFGLLHQDGRLRRMGLDDWERCLKDRHPQLSDLHGHFVAVRMSGRGVDLFTDAFGLRTAYLRKFDHEVHFASRLDLLSRDDQPRSINADVLGAQWLTFNRLSADPLLEDTASVPPNGVAHITPTGYEVSATVRPLSEESVPADQVRCRLIAASSPALLAPRRASLGLSGGVDSRLLLALLLGEGGGVSTHVFGAEYAPDVATSNEIAHRERLDHLHLTSAGTIAPADAKSIFEYGAYTEANFPASHCLRTPLYHALRRTGRAVIDGGFGEIGRRQFLNRVLLRAEDALLRRDAQRVMPFIRFDRANIFSAEVQKRLEQGSVRQLAVAMDALPDPMAIGAASFLDALALRTRLPFYFGLEQSRLDTLVESLMPYAQPIVVDALSSLPLRQRRSGALYKQIIRETSPSLSRVPLVKGRATYPFRFGTRAAWAWTAVQSRLRPATPDTTRHHFLTTLKPLIYDLLASQSTATCGLYELKKVRSLADDFFERGSPAAEVALDWWLALESWRRGVHGVLR